MMIDRLKPALETDIPGCAWLLRFDAAGKAEPGSVEDLARIGEPGEGFVWLHLDLADVRSRGLIESLAILSDEAREALTGPVDHQFLHHGDSTVCGALLDHERGLSGRMSQTDYLRFVFGEVYLVTARRRPLNSTELARVALSGGQIAPTPLAMFEEIVDRLCDELSKILSEITRILDVVEERIVDGRARGEQKRLGSTRRAAVRLSRQTGGLHSIFLRLETAATEPEHENLRDAAARLAQRTDALSRDVGSIQDRARLLQDELNSILNLETNDRLYVLTVVTTLLLPATFVTGYFGMNTKSLLFSENENGTLYATLLSIVASGLVLFLMRRMGLTRNNDA
jgi:zinc transporter